MTGCTLTITFALPRHPNPMPLEFNNLACITSSTPTVFLICGISFMTPGMKISSLSF